MGKNKNGFISMTLVYTFLIVFLFLKLAILTAYIEKDKYLETINEKISDDIGYTNSSRTTLLSSLISHNTPISIDNFNDEKSNIHLIDIASSENGNGNGFYYSTNPDIIDENSDGVYGKMYFFRGSTENNHLIFADKCWRIVRTNEDGSIRIRYNGEPDASNSCPTVDNLADNANKSHIAAIGKAKFSNTNNDQSDARFVTSTDGTVTHQSNIKSLLDQWFIDNLKDYADKIANSGFCNDITYYKAKDITPVYANNTDHSIYAAFYPCNILQFLIC